VKLLFIIIIISIQPLGQFGQEPEPSQATGMALVRCILGKFLGVITFISRLMHSNIQNLDVKIYVV
jgi:hypothetical protein